MAENDVPIVNIKIIQGETYDDEVEVLNPDGSGNPLDLTGYAVRSQLRVVEKASQVLEDFACVIKDGPNGIIGRHLSAAETAALRNPSMRHDVETVAPDGTVKRRAKGTAILDFEVTRSE